MSTKVLVKKYKILEPLASGGMATVYLAKNLATDEIVVAKIPNFAGLPNRDKLEKRFIREAKILSKINSKYVVTIHDYGQDEETGEFFLILEYLHGKTLEEITTSKERIPIPTIVDLSTQIAQVLNDLYNQGIIHRDIKSSNIKITSEGNIKLFDFGISKGKDLPAMTRSSDFLGTLQYMSPEQADGRDVDIRSDIYSAGIVIYEMLFGKLPFDAPSPVEVLEMQRKQDPIIPSDAHSRGIPTSLLSLMLRCMSKNPEDRYQTPAELINALESVSNELGISEKERTNLRKTRLTKISQSSVPTYVYRRNKKRNTVVAIVVAGVIALGGFLFAMRGCSKPLEPDFEVAQGQTTEYQLLLSKPPNVEDVVAKVTEVPEELIVSLERDDEEKSTWTLSTFAKFKTPLDIYEVKLDIEYIKEGNLAETDNQPFFVKVVEGNIGSKVMKIVSLEEIQNDSNATIEDAVLIDGQTYVPATQIGNVTSSTTQLDKENRTMTVSDADRTTKIIDGEKYVLIDGEKQDIKDAPTMIKDDMILSDETAEELFNIDVETNEEEGSVEILYFEPDETLSTITFKAINEEELAINGAEIYFDNNFKGLTPLNNMKLPNGTYNISIKMEGYEDSSDTLTLDSQQRMTKEYVLKSIPKDKPEAEEPKYGTLSVSVNVPWGDFIVDGKKYVNRTNLTLEDLPVGNHTVTFRLVGFQDKTQTLTIRDGETTVYDFKVNSGILKVRCNEPAIVYVDNRLLGDIQTPYDREVAAKTYNIRVDKTNYVDPVTGERPTNRTLTIKKGQTNTITFELVKKE